MICQSYGFTVSTKYVNDFKFDNIENFEYSNISFIENGGIELSRDYSEIFTSREMIWSVEKWKNGFLAGSGESAALFFINSQTNYNIFTVSNKILISDIQIIGSNIYFSAIPRASIYILDSGFTLKSEIHISNEYIWQIMPDKTGLYVFAGNPAEIYFYGSNNNMIWSLPVPEEKSILKGIVIGDYLYFFGDGYILYKTPVKNHRKIIAAASFDNNISDLILSKGKIYIITSIKDIQKPAQTQSGTASSDDDNSSRGSQSDKRGSKISEKSALYSYDLQGNLVELFQKSGIKFVSLTQIEDKLIIGSDKNAGYFEISQNDEVNKFTSLGNGKFARFISIDNESYGILLDPARIIKMNTSISKEGYFISSAFDTGNVSQWGSPNISSIVPAETGIDLYTRSGAIFNMDIWEDWSPVKDKIVSSPDRFIQYRVNLKSDGKKNPLFRSIYIPYVQKNIAPEIDKINIGYNNNVIKVSWDASDANKDTLIYDIYLSQNENSWVKINDKPLEDSSFDLNKENFPDGRYRIKITASDERSNTDQESKKSVKLSDYFIIDNTPPVIGDIILKKEGTNYSLGFSATDGLSQLYEACYSINGSKWIKILPIDSIFDSLSESFDIRLNLLPGSVVQVKVTDIFGNYSVKGVYSDK